MKVEKKSKTLNVKERNKLYGIYVYVRDLKQFKLINRTQMTFEYFIEKYAEKDFFQKVNDIFYKRVNNVLKGV